VLIALSALTLLVGRQEEHPTVVVVVVVVKVVAAAAAADCFTDWTQTVLFVINGLMVIFYFLLVIFVMLCSRLI